jgi:hypothetical protein
MLEEKGTCNKLVLKDHERYQGVKKEDPGCGQGSSHILHFTTKAPKQLEKGMLAMMRKPWPTIGLAKAGKVII